MNRAERSRLDRLNTWTCSDCGVTAVSEGCYPHGWWRLERRGGAHGGPLMFYACSAGCLGRVVVALLVAA